jgi:hypothetical protein
VLDSFVANAGHYIHSNPWLALAAVLAVALAATSGCGDLEPRSVPVLAKDTPSRAMGVCPPFPLRDQENTH